MFYRYEHYMSISYMALIVAIVQLFQMNIVLFVRLEFEYIYLTGSSYRRLLNNNEKLDYYSSSLINMINSD